MSRISAVLVGGLLLVCACGTPPRAAAVKPTPITVNAGVDRTWTAAIDAFAHWNIPVQAQDKKAGTLSSFGVLVTGADSTWADCGRTQGGDAGRPQLPNVGRYVATIKGDSATSTIQVDVLWVSGSGMVVKDCRSQGVWEKQFLDEVKAKAEQH
jgi:hypothetical protein